MTLKIELTLPELETVKARLERRKILYKTPRGRKMRAHGIDGVFTRQDLVAVYNITEKRIYYILGRGRAERIVDSLFSQGHELLNFKTPEGSIRHFKVIEAARRKYEADLYYWTPTEIFEDIFLCGAIEARRQEDGTYLIARRESMRPHPCENCFPEKLAESVVKCPQLNYALQLEGCIKLYNMPTGKAWRIIRDNKKESKEKE